MDREQRVKNRLLEKMARKAESSGREHTAKRLRDKIETGYGWLYLIIIIVLIVLLWLVYNGTIDITPLLEKYGIYRP